MYLFNFKNWITLILDSGGQNRVFIFFIYLIYLLLPIVLTYYTGHEQDFFSIFIVSGLKELIKSSLTLM